MESFILIILVIRTYVHLKSSEYLSLSKLQNLIPINTQKAYVIKKVPNNYTNAK